MWPLFQAALAATTAWAIALRLAGHPDPFFAPIAALVALNAPRGERGLQALPIVSGVMVGIMVGEGTASFLGAGFGLIGLAALVAMMIARMAGGARIVVIQAGTAAILTVIAADGDAGWNRMIDALIGGATAMLFSQVLFAPEPVAMLRRAETTALLGIAGGLDGAARALEKGDSALAERALTDLRGVRDRLGELARLRKASKNVVRHSVIWRSQQGPLVRERENADHLDLLGGACVMLVRAMLVPGLVERERLATGVRELADAVSELAQAPGDRDTRQRAADRALVVPRSTEPGDAPSGSSSNIAFGMLRTVATDVLVFAGVDPADAEAAAQHGDSDLKVAKPPATPNIPFGFDKWRGLLPGRSPGKFPRGDSDRSDVDREQ